MIKYEKNIQYVIIDSFSRNIFLICTFFLLALILTLIFKDPRPATKDIIIFLIPIIATVSILKKRHLELNKPRNTGRLETRSLIRKKFENFGLDEIEEIELNKGRGSGNAGNYFITIKLNNSKRLKIMTTDAFQSNKEINEIYEELRNWIKS
ncbi:hypothetical protein [Halobacteriovorax sp. YZS-1-1]|uniref:hypothetical protein n=1 Tax=unclassified Halobacteriovorax TaxID=2639665 RepID=UPI00399A2AED